jgi:hypothetical protein
MPSAEVAQSVWVDTAYRSAKNEHAVCARGLKSKIHFRKPKGNAIFLSKPLCVYSQTKNQRCSRCPSVATTNEFTIT